ncbi:MAG: anti-sigma factor antagonist [Magnetococcales bacterium]|nr:anti-sigma factor antagonist [Magnetococcales bacterium]
MSLHGFIKNGAKTLTVDASGVEEVNGTILLILDSARSLLQQSGRNMVLQNPSPRFVFKMKNAGLNFFSRRERKQMIFNKSEKSSVNCSAY